jgi:hypothetical protein
MAKAKTKALAGEGKNPYNCQYTLMHNGNTYQSSELVELTDEEAQSLLETGVIVPTRIKQGRGPEKDTE